MSLTAIHSAGLTRYVTGKDKPGWIKRRDQLNEGVIVPAQSRLWLNPPLREVTPPPGCSIFQEEGGRDAQLLLFEKSTNHDGCWTVAKPCYTLASECFHAHIWSLMDQSRPSSTLAGVCT